VLVNLGNKKGARVFKTSGIEMSMGTPLICIRRALEKKEKAAMTIWGEDLRSSPPLSIGTNKCFHKQKGGGLGEKGVEGGGGA